MVSSASVSLRSQVREWALLPGFVCRVLDADRRSVSSAHRKTALAGTTARGPAVDTSSRWSTAQPSTGAFWLSQDGVRAALASVSPTRPWRRWPRELVAAPRTGTTLLVTLIFGRNLHTRSGLPEFVPRFDHGND